MSKITNYTIIFIMCFFLCITTICCNNGNAIKYEGGKNNSVL